MQNEIQKPVYEKLRPEDLIHNEIVEVEEVDVVIKETREVGIKESRPTDPTINLRSMPVLQALSKATAETMQPLKLYSNDRLILKLNEDGDRFIAKAVSINSDGMYRTASYNARKFFGRVPEHYERGDYVILAGTDFTALTIYNSWPENQIIFEDENARTLYLYLIFRFLKQTQNAVIQAKFKLNREVPPMPEGFVDHPDLPLADYQKCAVALCTGNEAYCLWLKQGLGKTPVAIAKICTEAKWTREGLYGKPRMMRVFIGCPRQSRLNWKLEIERFATVPGKIAVLRGGKLRRIQALTDAMREEEDCFFSITIGSLESVEKTWEAFSQIAWDLIILDEAQGIKNPNSNRSKMWVRKLRQMSARRLQLTGTPRGNSNTDLYPQFEFLGEGLSGFATWQNFRKFHSSIQTKDLISNITATNIPLLQERISRLAFTLNKQEAGIKLPDKVFDIYEISMTPKQAELYTRLQNELRVEITNMTKEGSITDSITAEHILTKLLRLAQITSGHVKYDEVWENGVLVRPASVTQISDKNPKVDAVLDIYAQDQADDSNGKMVIWAIFDEDIRILSEALAKQGINHVGYKPQVVKEFRKSGADLAEIEFNTNPDCKIFLGNPKSGGSALNLVGYNFRDAKCSDTSYCNHVIFFSKSWSMIDRAQAQDRSAERRSSRCNVRVTDLEILDSIDTVIRERVFGKMQMASVLQDIREILNQVLKIEEYVEE